MILNDLDFIENQSGFVHYKTSDWKKLKKELSNYIITKNENGVTIKPLENMYDYLMTSDISHKMATHNLLYNLSSATRKEQTINYHDGQQHLNLWGLVFGPSSLARKTTTEKKSKILLKQAGLTVIPGKFTASALFMVLNKYGNGAIIGSEFSSWLKTFKKEHSNELPELMCEIYDSEDEVTRTTRSFDEETIVDPYITFYGGTTPFAYKHVTEEFFTQGLGMRILYCMEIEKEKYKKISLGAANTMSFNKDVSVGLLSAINKSVIKNIERGDDKNIPVAYTQYQNYCDIITQRILIDELSFVYSYYGRTPEFVLKIAGLLELTRAVVFNIKLETIGLQDDTINLAVKIVRMFEQEFRMLIVKVRNAAISNPVRTDKDVLYKVKKTIDNYGALTNGDLLIDTDFDRNKLRTITSTLIERCDIAVTIAPKKGRGSKQQLFYSLNDKWDKLDDIKAQILWLKQEARYGEAEELQAKYKENNN